MFMPSRRPKVMILIWKDRYFSRDPRRSGKRSFGSLVRAELIFYQDMSDERLSRTHGDFDGSRGPGYRAQGLGSSTGWSSRWSSWSSRWLPPSSFAYPVELRPCIKSFHAPHVPYAPECSKRPISKDQTCICMQMQPKTTMNAKEEKRNKI
ncbi:unnamed protein product [Microthlaspi erraticum]|uniref:Uncharacterized protein n=1 Tax=Microthlaspi erraticum TaxID=1685480 RepID=A0A6D2JXY4_9BRAS|nr:unnamed protein product [Microthlaspi erraticum]